MILLDSLELSPQMSISDILLVGMITSTSNSKIKEIKALQSKRKNRIKSGAFVVEGIRVLEEALYSGFMPILTINIEQLSERAEVLVQRSIELGC